MRASRGRARLGLLVPFTNTNLEPDMALMCPAGLSIHTARLGGYDEDEVPGVAQMQGLGDEKLDEPLRLLNGVTPDVVLYGCTSATLTHGVAFDQNLAARIRTGSGAATVTAAGALVFALQSLGVGKIGFASPYVAEINAMAVDFLADMGIETIKRADFGEALSNEGQGALTPQDVISLGLRAEAEEVEAIVLSCTDMRSVEAIASLEKQTGKPVVTSNQAMLFQSLSLLGLGDTIDGFGTLLARPR